MANLVGVGLAGDDWREWCRSDPGSADCDAADDDAGVSAGDCAERRDSDDTGELLICTEQLTVYVYLSVFPQICTGQ